MALYIHPENQKIIWETIHRHSSIESIHPSVRTDWFKGVVKKMYEMIPKQWFQQKITTEQLNTINQATIKYMINDLKPVILQHPQSHQQAFSNNNVNSSSIFSENKSNHTDVIQERFLEKQKEMESMLNIKSPSQVNFKIDEIDEPISNMEELIKQHMSQRELDIQPIISSAVIPQGNDIQKLVIMEELDPHSVRDARNIHNIIDITTPSSLHDTPENISSGKGSTLEDHMNYKHVTFHEPMNHDKEIQLLKTNIQTIQTEVSELKIMMHDFLEQMSKTTSPNIMKEPEP